jgi:hypothetical protein
MDIILHHSIIVHMAQTIEGARKIAAAHQGISLEEYNQRLAAGLKWCSLGKHWALQSDFCSDSNRTDGLSAHCNRCRQARHKMVRAGVLANPNDIPCLICGHIGQDRRHEYDHHLGYLAEHQESVQALCSRCHRKKHRRSKCSKGHDLTGPNVVMESGHRRCKLCRRLKDRGRRDASYWREYRRKRKDKNVSAIQS